MRETEIEIELQVQLPESVRESIAAERFRRESAKLNTRAANEVSSAAVKLHGDLGLTYREIGTVLGVSYQRKKGGVCEFAGAEGLCQPI